MSTRRKFLRVHSENLLLFPSFLSVLNALVSHVCTMKSNKDAQGEEKNNHNKLPISNKIFRGSFSFFGASSSPSAASSSGLRVNTVANGFGALLPPPPLPHPPPLCTSNIQVMYEPAVPADRGPSSLLPSGDCR